MLDLTELAKDAGLEAHAVQFAAVAPRFAIALLIGTVIAVRPWRYLMGRRPPRPEMAQAQILLCVAAAIVTIVIGESLAKAFGLVGLGSFVRFRSGLKDPRDAAVLFLLIGLGMACGHGSIGVALSGALLGALLLAVLDLFKVPDIAAKEERGTAAVVADADPPGRAPVVPAAKPAGPPVAAEPGAIRKVERGG